VEMVLPGVDELLSLQVLPEAAGAEGVVQGAVQQLQLQELQVLSCRSHVCVALCWKVGHARGDLRERCCPCCLTKETSNGTKIRKMNKISDFRDDPTTKLKMVISFCMYLQIG
jgi:hypothetical protein